MKPDDYDDFDVNSFSHLLWRYRILVGIFSLLGALVAGWMAFTAPPYFKVEAVATEVRERGGGMLGGLANQLGGLASLAGVNIGQGAGSAGQESAALLESHYLAEEFIRRNHLIPVLLHNSSKPPTLWRAVKELTQNVLVIRRDQRKGTTTIEMQWTDPAIVAQWANAYFALANQMLRTRALEESERNIAYLNRQLANTESVELRKVMYNLIENETKNLMIANGRAEYAFEIVDPAVPPELKAGPHRLTNTIVGFMLGLAFGSACAFGFDRLRRWRSRMAPSGAESLKSVSA